MKLKKIIEKTVIEYLLENEYNKYLDPTYKKNMDIFDMPVDFMWKYREFDRCSQDNIWGNEYIAQLTKDIKENGIQRPIILQLNNGRGLIVEGNHRLCIAIKLGIKTIPVRVVYKSFDSINKHKTKPIYLNPDELRMGIFDEKDTDKRLKNTAKDFIKNFELPYFEYKNKLNFKQFDEWLIGNEQVQNFLIGELEIYNVEPYNDNRKLTNEILKIMKSKFNRIYDL